MKNIYLFLMGACIALGSCSTGDNGVSSFFGGGGSSQALLYLGSKAVSEDEVEFEFSRKVSISQINFEPKLSIASVEEGSTVKIKLEEGTKPGVLITADLLAEDEKRNTINVLVSFRSRNNRMPDMVINEVNAVYSKPKAEFIEFKMKSNGNLGAARVVIHGNTNAAKQTIYEFKPVEVKKDDYVTLHLRTTEDGSLDEYGTNLSESGGPNSSPTGRDFWIAGSAKLMHIEASIIYVLDQDDKVLAAVMISNQTANWWGKDYLAEAAEMIYNNGAWKSKDGKLPGPIDAVNPTGATATRTICRDESTENTKTQSEWYITATSSATPGKANNPTRYVPKP
ncbi:MAG: hypothetical protein FWB73_04755 [Treponema sp.]|nr:hypothetical protein [Treponema sp.]